MTVCLECGEALPEVLVLRGMPPDFAREGEPTTVPMVHEVEGRVCQPCYDKAREQFRARVNGDLNPGIRETVRWLIENDFNTRDSGDGKTHLMEGDRDYPYVSILIDPRDILTEAHRLQGLVNSLPREGGATLDATGPSIPTIQVTYDPDNQIAVLELLYADDKALGLGGRE